MSRSFIFLALGLLALSAAASSWAGVPAPNGATRGIPCDPFLRSKWELVPGPAPCQYRFAANGALDELVVLLTLRDCFDTPVPDCAVQATLTPNAGTVAFCACEPETQIEVTNGVGAAEFRYGRLGGRGALSVALTLLCLGSTGFPSLELDFATPDQNGSCEVGSSTNIIDLGIWAGGLSGYVQSSDLDCSGSVGVLDLALFAQGLGVGCP